MIHDLRVLLRLSKERTSEPRAAIVDSRTLRSTPESGSRGGYDGHKNKKGSKVHDAVDTLGHLLALRVGPANEDDRKELEKLSESAAEHGIRLEVVKHEEAKGGFVLLPRRWVVE